MYFPARCRQEFNRNAALPLRSCPCTSADGLTAAAPYQAVWDKVVHEIPAMFLLAVVCTFHQECRHIPPSVDQAQWAGIGEREREGGGGERGGQGVIARQQALRLNVGVDIRKSRIAAQLLEDPECRHHTIEICRVGTGWVLQGRNGAVHPIVTAVVKSGLRGCMPSCLVKRGCLCKQDNLEQARPCHVNWAEIS